MDDLIKRQSRSYDYISRYTTFPFYYNVRDNKYIYGITSNLKTDVTYVLHKVEMHDTLDSLANKYYGRPDLFWVIADFNRIQDPFHFLYGRYNTIKVPSISAISWK